ncbi:class E sortase [Streptomyces sp. H27-C3]|uniref:class E sortase n=1 Tax=Streptomyces sp. H27-C3 TaxID=3046305 RepID=UPI0024BA2D0F|nr:class E sortase [Streptomyces sp. H27-C3]MDJ0461095.1 class E sortase [Streptomyces sp. H27-C3]
MPVVVRRTSRGRIAAARGLWAGAEIAVTFGVVVLLLVVHQLWWTNRQARDGAEREVQALEREWVAGERAEGAGSGEDRGLAADLPAEAGEASAEPSGGAPGAPRAARKPPAPRWDQAYAILRVPRLDVTAPVAQGISKGGVLDKGYVGHYPQTAQPGRPGNFALAGHRNTHGEPFRYINRLRGGDEIRVETKDAVYTYAVGRTLAQTTARDSGVIAQVPRSNLRNGVGYSEPGYYLTLTTCTPEYTSKYRLVVWATLTSMRPR